MDTALRTAPDPARRRLLGRAAVVSLGCAGLTACTALRTLDTRAPMQVLRIPADRRSDHLLVMLPGAYSRPQEFQDEGFIHALQSAGWPHDVMVADTHLGYVTQGLALTRLHLDVLTPAREQGYRHIWLLGISLGGFVALLQAARPDPGIEGVVALAPYLGPRTLVSPWLSQDAPTLRSTLASEQARLAALDPADRGLTEDDVVKHLWVTHGLGRTSVRTWIGWGLSDRFARINQALASLLPADRRWTAPGGHDWPVWRELWSRWLADQAPGVWPRSPVERPS